MKNLKLFPLDMLIGGCVPYFPWAVSVCSQSIRVLGRQVTRRVIETARHALLCLGCAVAVVKNGLAGCVRRVVSVARGGKGR